MKNTVQVRRDGGKKSASVQTKSPRCKPVANHPSPQAETRQAPRAPDLPRAGAVLMFFGSKADAVLADVQISAKKFRAISRAAKNSGFSFEQFLIRGMVGMLKILEVAS